ncbi:ABC transporter ATP-binding protein [Flavobacteriaceae bacterium]|nr:ABC transporter ATP-binding protein [Flavobacteriaceae bacterium]
MGKKLLELNALSKSFGNLKAVDALSLSLEKGNIYGLLGPNGSGKSTTLGMVLNVVNPTKGSFQWYGGSLSTHQALKKIGAIIERPNFYPYMTAVQNLKLICKIKECSEDGIKEQLQLVGLWERRNSKFSTFSLGMKQRLAIAAALVNQPELLILDEPTNGLDPQGIHQIRELIIQIAKKGTTILLASHLLDEVEKVCSHVIILKNGVKQYEGTVDGMSHSYGYFELATNDNKILVSLLEKHEAVGKIKEENNIVTAYLKHNLDTITLSKSITEHQLYLTHLIKQKPSLEEQFLSLTEKENS